MPRYEFKCRECGFVMDTLEQAAGPCPQCHGSMRRNFKFMAPGPNAFPDREHFNHSIGQYVVNNRDFENKLKRKSDQMSERLGIDCDYRSHEHGDKIGVTDE